MNTPPIFLLRPVGPAEDVPELNRHIIGPIEVIAEYKGTDEPGHTSL